MAAEVDDLRAALSALGVPALGRFLREGLGFRVVARGAGASWRREGELWRLEGTGLAVRPKVATVGSHGVAVQSLTLTNEDAHPSPPISVLDVLHLPLTVRMKDAPRAWAFGNGMAEGIYPSRAFNEVEVCFGRACQSDPKSQQWTRWWTGKRWFTLGEGRSTFDRSMYLPILQVDWEDEGGAIGLWAALEWSGRYDLQFGTMEDWQFLLRGGPAVKGMVLDPGEALELPAVHVGVYRGTPEDGHNSIRRYIRDVIAPDVDGRRPWPYVAYHHWFGMYEKVSDELLRAQADVAARLGVEYFELDAGWYANDGERYFEGIGNWERVDERKFPQGVEPLARYVRSKGMRFGMWFEPERGRKGSDIVREHPDWFWGGPDAVNLCADLTRREVQDGLIDLLSRWCQRLDVRWVRWDGALSPEDFWDAVDPTGKVQFRYLEGLYRVIDTLLARFPGLLFDNCGGQGRRKDFAALRRSGTTMYDQAEDPHIARRMQTAAARILPPHMTHLSICMSPGDGDDTIGPLDLISRMAGAFSLSGHISEWSDGQIAMVRRHLDAFRSYRHLLSGDFHRLSPIPRSAGDWDVVQFLDPGTGEALVLAFRMRGGTGSMTIVPKRLRPEARYEVVDPFAERVVAMLSAEELTRGFELELPPDSAAARHLRPL